MKIKEVFPILEQMAPLAYAEDFDNVGHLLGDAEQELTGILVCHDALEAVIDEAIAKNTNLIVCFHPIVFSGLKKITGKNYVERVVLKALQNQICIYAVHTALDNQTQGVNKILSDALGLENSKILIPKSNHIQKLITYTIPSNADQVRSALFSAGAGSIGNYQKCSFNSEGIGTYEGNSESNPVIGERGEWVQSEEVKIEVTFEKQMQSRVLQALFKAHIYEEVAYEIYELKNLHQQIGLGRVGELPEPLSELGFFQLIREKLDAQGIRHSPLLGKPIKKVAVLGGSGAFAIDAAQAAGADALVTSDLKYHDFYRAENRMLLLDVGHYESERFTKNYIVDYLTENLTNFAPAFITGTIFLSEVNTNPVKYF